MMWNDEDTNHEGAEDCVYADYIGQEGGDEHEEKCQHHDAGCRTVLETAGLADQDCVRFA